MLSLIVIYAVISLLCFPVVLFFIHSSPAGFEDENGFHKEDAINEVPTAHFYGAHKSA